MAFFLPCLLLDANGVDTSQYTVYDHSNTVLQRQRSWWKAQVGFWGGNPVRSEEHTSELQSLRHLVCRLLLVKNKSTLATLWSITPTSVPPSRLCGHGAP